MMKNIFTSKQRLVRLAYATGLLSLVLAVALSLSVGGTLAANMFATAPGLGVAESFAVLGGSTVTNTGTSNVYGNLGVSPGSAVTGFPPGIVHPPGVIHAADAVALNAQTDVTTAYNDLAGQACDVNLTGQDLGGLTLTPGVYCFDSSAQLTGTLTLDAQGDENSVFIFKIGSTLTTASNSIITMINGANLCNLFWQVGSSATLGTTTAFKGNILALTSITLNTGAWIDGRALARNGAVTMDTNTVDITICTVEPTPTATNTLTATTTLTATPTPTPTATLPEATQTAIAATQTAIATLPVATQTAILTQTAIAATQTAIATLPAATQTAIATQTLQAATKTAQAATQTIQAATQTAQATTQTAQATEDVKPTSTAEPETLPDTGGDLAGPDFQLIRDSLGVLGITLILFGFLLSRNIRKAEK